VDRYDAREIRLRRRFENLFESLGDDSLRRIVCLRLEGFTGEEIAEQLGCNRRTVTRKLELIRETWLELVP